MTKEDFIKKYIYGIGNDALTDRQEAIDMAKDLDRYFAEQLRKSLVNDAVCSDCAEGRDPFEPNWKCPECRR